MIGYGGCDKLLLEYSLAPAAFHSVAPRFGFGDEAGERVEVTVEHAIGQRKNRPTTDVTRLKVLRIGSGLPVRDRRILCREQIDRLLRVFVAAELKVVVGEVIE